MVRMRVLARPCVSGVHVGSWPREAQAMHHVTGGVNLPERKLLGTQRPSPLRLVVPNAGSASLAWIVTRRNHCIQIQESAVSRNQRVSRMRFLLFDLKLGVLEENAAYTPKFFIKKPLFQYNLYQKC
eukprot:2795876-Rhodomonas_salina.1